MQRLTPRYLQSVGWQISLAYLAPKKSVSYTGEAETTGDLEKFGLQEFLMVNLSETFLETLQRNSRVSKSQGALESDRPMIWKIDAQTDGVSARIRHSIRIFQAPFLALNSQNYAHAIVVANVTK